MEPEESKGTSASARQAPHDAREERKERAQTRQDQMNNAFLTQLNNLSRVQSNPIGGLVNSVLPLFQNVMEGAGTGGGNPFSQSLGSMFPSEVNSSSTFLHKVMIGCSLQEVIALMNGNYEILTQLHPRVKALLLNDYMNGVDNEENKKQAVTRIAEEINSEVLIPETLEGNIIQGSNPLQIAKDTNTKHISRVINMILDIEHNSDDNSFFIKSVKRKMRWWVGEFIDNLKPHFQNHLRDVLLMIRSNFERVISNLDEGVRLLSGQFTDTIMQTITSSYTEYVKDKKREDEAEARESGITLEELYKQRRESENSSKMDVDPAVNDEPKIEEEKVHPITGERVAPVKTTTATPAKPQKGASEAQRQTAEPQIEERDPEIRKLLEDMDEDQSMLVVDPPKRRPVSRTYRALDGYFDMNLESGASITELTRPRTTLKDSLKNNLKKALKDAGFSGETVSQIMKDKDVSDEFVNHYKEILKAEIKDKKNDPNYVPGRFPELDRLYQ